jgi:hypothetical protein
MQKGMKMPFILLVMYHTEDNCMSLMAYKKVQYLLESVQMKTGCLKLVNKSKKGYKSMRILKLDSICLQLLKIKKNRLNRIIKNLYFKKNISQINYTKANL